jgi:hypothetical protein
MRVNVRGRPLDFPQRCACCGQPPSIAIQAATEKNADPKSRRQATAWRFPVCTPCARHAARWRAARIISRWFLLGGLGLALLSALAGSFAAFLLMGITAFGAAALAGYLVRREALGLCHMGCAAPGPPVAYIGSLDDVESFEFVQKAYAGDFMRANLDKLAALPHETQSLIQPDLDRIAAAAAAERERVRADEAKERERIRAAEAERKALEQERVRIAAEVAHDNEVYEKCLARMDAAKGPAGRKAALETGLRSLRQEHVRERLMLDASRIEVSAALVKAEGLKSPAAKLRTLSEALDAIRNDSIPDHLQLESIRSLESAIAAIEDEKNSIDMI